MERAAPVKIMLPTKVQENVTANLKQKHMRMMMGSLVVPGGTSKGKKNKKKSADQNHHRMLISAPAGKHRGKHKGGATGLQNRFASRRSHIPMAQETPDQRSVRIERHRKKQFSQKHVQHEQELLQKLQKGSHKHTSHIVTARHGGQSKTTSAAAAAQYSQPIQPGKHTAEELKAMRSDEHDRDNRQMQVLTALMKRIAGTAKFFADENIARSVMTEVDQDEMSGLRRGFDMNPGGLTLAQFIELMMGFVPVNKEEEDEIQAMHKHHHHRVHHKHHHRHHTADGKIVHVKGKARLQLARNLCELFEQIDINGDGTLEWDEFTSYCVSQGLANDRKKSENIKRYKLLRTHLGYKEGIGVIENMQSFVLNGDEWDYKKANLMRMARITHSSTKQAYSNSGPSTVSSSSGMTLVTCDRNAIHRGTFALRDPKTGRLLKRIGEGVHKSAVLAVCYIPCMEYIVTSSADLTLGFWDSHKHDLRQLMPVNEEMCSLHWVDAKDAGLRADEDADAAENTSIGKIDSAAGKEQNGPTPKTGRGRFASVLSRVTAGIRVGTLYTGGVNGNITGWDVAHMFVEAILQGHTDSITSFVSISSLRLLVSGSMDSTVRIWNLRSNAPLKVLRGHVRGVTSVSFSNEQRVLCSCGFDHEVLVWNPYVETRPSGKLRGHTCSVLRVECVEGTYEAISVDIEGNVRIWDLRTLSCVQILASHEANGAENHLYDHVHNPNTPNPDMFKDIVKSTGGDCLSWCYVHHPEGNRIMISTERHLRVYAYDEVNNPRVADKNVSNVIVYNPLTCSFLTAGGRSCKTWDAVSGKLLKTFQNIVEEEKVEITAVCFDDQYRQFILGDTLGRVRMYQCANGQLLRDLVFHNDGGEVVSILFNAVTDCIYSSSSRGQLIVQQDDGEGVEGDEDENEDVAVGPEEANQHPGDEESAGRQAGELFRKTRHHLVRLFTRKEVLACEVTALVQAPALHLLAWGGADGDVVILDALTGNTEGMCIAATMTTDGCRVAVTAISFLEPYPMLAVAYSDGSVQVWSVRPFYIRQCSLMIFYNYKEPKVHVSPALAASAPWVEKSSVRPTGETVDITKMCWDRSGMCLVAGDSNGSVLKWNFKYLLLKLHVQEFHLVDSGEDVGGSGSGSGGGGGGSGGNDSGPPTKLGDVLHPDLKRTTMSAREQLEESLAASPRVFEDPPPENTQEEEKIGMSELAGTFGMSCRKVVLCSCSCSCAWYFDSN
jgi:WD40 repeat protein